MKRFIHFLFLPLVFAALSLPVHAAQEGVTVAVQGGYVCDYGVNIPFTRSPRTGSYTFSLYPGGAAAGSPEVTAAVEITSAAPVNVYLPLRYDPAGPSTWTLAVTAHVAPGRKALDREATAARTFTTAPTCGCPAGTAGAYYVGDGSAQRPFLVGAREQLAHMEKHLAASLLQVADIDCGGTLPTISCFTGSYDGGWHKISGLDKPLFWTLRQATVQRLGIEDSTAIFPTLSDHIGILAGSVHDGTIRDCYSLNCSLKGYNTGGLIGGFFGEASRIERCYARGARVDSHSSPAGLVGRADEARFQMSHCYAIPAYLSTESAGYPSGALFGSSAYDGHTTSITQSYWCTSVVSNGAGGAYLNARVSIDSYSKGLPLAGFSTLGNLTGFDDSDWVVRHMTFDSPGGSVTAEVPVLRGFYE